MKHDRQVALLDRMLELRKRREGQHIYDTVLHLPLDVYTNQDIFEREMETLFSDSPLVSGHIDSVREPDCSMLSDWIRDYGPKDCSVAESMGLVWVHPTRGESFDPAQELGAFAEDFAEFHLERFVSYKKVVTEKTDTKNSEWTIPGKADGEDHWCWAIPEHHAALFLYARPGRTESKL